MDYETWQGLLKGQNMHLNRGVIEGVNDTKERFTPADAELYIDRLTHLCETRASLDSGNYPLSHYSSGEVIKRWVNSNKEVVREEYAQLPIQKPLRGREKGLRFGILHAIYGTRNILYDMGLGDVAEEILVFDSHMPGGKPRDPGSYIGNREAEDCGGK